MPSCVYVSRPKPSQSSVFRRRRVDLTFLEAEKSLRSARGTIDGLQSGTDESDQRVSKGRAETRGLGLEQRNATDLPCAHWNGNTVLERSAISRIDCDKVRGSLNMIAPEMQRQESVSRLHVVCLPGLTSTRLRVDEIQHLPRTEPERGQPTLPCLTAATHSEHRLQFPALI